MRHRVLMVSDFFYPNFGGVESHIYQLSQCLIKLGHKVVILTHAYGERTGVRYLTEGLKVYYAARPPFYLQSSFPTFFGGFRLLRSILIRERITLVHSHQAFSMLGDQAVVYARTMGYKVVFTDHSLFGFADLASIVINKIMKYVLCDVHGVICVSHTSKENIVLRACIPPSRVSVIPNAVDASHFEPPEFPRKDGFVTIVSLTRLVYRKGLDLIAAIMPEVIRKHPNVRIIICGDGPKKKLLEEVIAREELEDRVELLPGVPHNKARSILLPLSIGRVKPFSFLVGFETILNSFALKVKGDIFLNASLTEAFCIAIVEAASAGLRVVSTKVGGVPEVLPSDMLILAEPNPQSLLDGLDSAIESLHTIDPWKQHAKVEKMYSWQRVAKRTERVYNMVCRSDRDDSMLARLIRFHKCGFVAGKIFCFLSSMHHMYWRVLEWWDPADEIDLAPDLIIGE